MNIPLDTVIINGEIKKMFKNLWRPKPLMYQAVKCIFKWSSVGIDSLLGPASSSHSRKFLALNCLHVPATELAACSKPVNPVSSLLRRE